MPLASAVTTASTRADLFRQDRRAGADELGIAEHDEAGEGHVVADRDINGSVRCTPHSSIW